MSLQQFGRCYCCPHFNDDAIEALVIKHRTENLYCKLCHLRFTGLALPMST